MNFFAKIILRKKRSKKSKKMKYEIKKLRKSDFFFCTTHAMEASTSLVCTNQTFRSPRIF